MDPTFQRLFVGVKNKTPQKFFKKVKNGNNEKKIKKKVKKK